MDSLILSWYARKITALWGVFCRESWLQIVDFGKKKSVLYVTHIWKSALNIKPLIWHRFSKKSVNLSNWYFSYIIFSTGKKSLYSALYDQVYECNRPWPWSCKQCSLIYKPCIEGTFVYEDHRTAFLCVPASRSLFLAFAAR